MWSWTGRGRRIKSGPYFKGFTTYSLSLSCCDIESLTPLQMSELRTDVIKSDKAAASSSVVFVSVQDICGSVCFLSETFLFRWDWTNVRLYVNPVKTVIFSFCIVHHV